MDLSIAAHFASITTETATKRQVGFATDIGSAKRSEGSNHDEIGSLVRRDHILAFRVCPSHY